jgi:hypothetical protein
MQKCDFNCKTEFLSWRFVVTIRTQEIETVQLFRANFTQGLRRIAACDKKIDRC